MDSRIDWAIALGKFGWLERLILMFAQRNLPIRTTELARLSGANRTAVAKATARLRDRGVLDRSGEIADPATWRAEEGEPPLDFCPPGECRLQPLTGVRLSLQNVSGGIDACIVCRFETSDGCKTVALKRQCMDEVTFQSDTPDVSKRQIMHALTFQSDTPPPIETRAPAPDSAFSSSNEEEKALRLKTATSEDPRFSKSPRSLSGSDARASERASAHTHAGNPQAAAYAKLKAWIDKSTPSEVEGGADFYRDQACMLASRWLGQGYSGAEIQGALESAFKRSVALLSLSNYCSAVLSRARGATGQAEPLKATPKSDPGEIARAERAADAARQKLAAFRQSKKPDASNA